MANFVGLLATFLLLVLPPACAESGARVGSANATGADPRATTGPDPTVVYLEFFRRWDTPLDDAATRMFSRLVRLAPDFKAFQVVAPPGSEERQLFERHLASFEEAGPLIRSGQMNENLFFEAWYDTPSSWNKAKAYVLGMRNETSNQQLYREFEWLAEHSQQFWSKRDKNAPQWHPISYAEPTASDRAIFLAFNGIWSTPRDAIGREFLAGLRKRAESFDEFRSIVTPGSEEYIKFDRVLCAYDQAGALIKNGILHPKLFFGAWQSPVEVWSYAEPWVKGLRANGKSPHLYDNVDWLVAYETDWRGKVFR
jgi:hypothetical protein